MAELDPLVYILNAISQSFIVLEEDKGWLSRERDCWFVLFFSSHPHTTLRSLCAWLKDVLIAEERERKRGKGRKKAIPLADRFLITLFVVEIFHLEGWKVALAVQDKPSEAIANRPLNKT
jgi:hypothetical protein